MQTTPQNCTRLYLGCCEQNQSSIYHTKLERKTKTQLTVRFLTGTKWILRNSGKYLFSQEQEMQQVYRSQRF